MVVKTWGTPREEPELLNHVDLVAKLGIADLEKGTAVAGEHLNRHAPVPGVDQPGTPAQDLQGQAMLTRDTGVTSGSAGFWCLHVNICAVLQRVT